MLFNPLKFLIKKIQEFFVSNISEHKLRNDKELECLQFGICTVQAQSPRPEEFFLGK